MLDLTSFRERLRNRRKELNLTQTQLGARCGVSAQEISHFENGRRAPELEMLINLCNALNTSPNALLWDYFGPRETVKYDFDQKDSMKSHVRNVLHELERLEEYYD